MGRTKPGKHEVLRDAVRKSLMLTAVLACINIAVYLLAVERFNQWGVWLSTSLGYYGVAVFVFFLDMLIMPTSVDVLFPFVMKWHPVPLILVMSCFSSLGGYAGYWIARSFNRWDYIQKSVDSYREMGEDLVNRYGAWAVAVAGFTPIPFSTVCWIAGLLRVHAGWTALACASRFPRMILYYLLFRGGIFLLG